jgi:cytoskeleton protein RodZ
VRETYLAALETEEFDALGGDVYARGFIAAYARFLRLDPQPLLDAHREYREGPGRERPRRAPRRSPAPYQGDVRVRSGRAAVLLMLVLVVVVALVVAGLWDGADSVRGAAGWR